MAGKVFEFGFRIAAAIGADFKASFGAAGKEIAELNSKISENKKLVKMLDRAQKSGVITAESYANAMGHITPEMEALQEKQKNILDQQAKWTGLGSKSLGAFAKGAAFAGAGQALLGFTQHAIKFESSMADVKKVVDFDTPEQFRQMSKDVLDLSTKIPMTAEGLAQIVAAGGQSGGHGLARQGLPAFRDGRSHDVEREDERKGVEDHVRRNRLDAERIADERGDDDDLQVARRDHREERHERHADQEDDESEGVCLEHGCLFPFHHTVRRRFAHPVGGQNRIVASAPDEEKPFCRRGRRRQGVIGERGERRRLRGASEDMRRPVGGRCRQPLRRRFTRRQQEVARRKRRKFVVRHRQRPVVRTDLPHRAANRRMRGIEAGEVAEDGQQFGGKLQDERKRLGKPRDGKGVRPRARRVGEARHAELAARELFKEREEIPALLLDKRQHERGRQIGTAAPEEVEVRIERGIREREDGGRAVERDGKRNRVVGERGGAHKRGRRLPIPHGHAPGGRGQHRLQTRMFPVGPRLQQCDGIHAQPLSSLRTRRRTSTAI